MYVILNVYYFYFISKIGLYKTASILMRNIWSLIVGEVKNLKIIISVILSVN